MIDKEKDLTPEQQERVAQLRRMTPREWDAICKKCGICCLYKIVAASGRTLYLNRSCQHLDCATHQCKIYDTRLRMRPHRCEKVTLDLVLDGLVVPASCGYVEYIFGPAKFPAQVDFTTIRPISDKEIDHASDMDLFWRLIPQSVRWNQR